MIQFRPSRKPFCTSALGMLILFTTLFSCSNEDYNDYNSRPATLPNVSGLSWVEENTFIGVHDAKNNDEKKDWPRLSIIQTATSEYEGVLWESIYPVFPGPGGFSSDLESCSSIPGGKGYLFAESGQEGTNFKRIFHGVLENNTISIIDYLDWPVEIENVEATEVYQLNDQLMFLYAERAEDSPSTKIRWANLSLYPLSFGDFKEVIYQAIDPVVQNSRPIVAMDIDSDGFIYTVSAFDLNIDSGPFRSVVWKIGKITSDSEGNPLVDLNMNERLADLDGLKVESIAISEIPGDSKKIYIGTDDEYYGGIIRLLPQN